MAAIPSLPTDKNYVDTWLEERMLEYQQTRRNSTAAKLARAMFGGGPRSGKGGLE